MDATQYGESDFVTKDIVKASKTKIAIILSDAKVEETDFGMKLEFQVELDNKKKRFRPSKDIIKNLISAYGADTKSWLGKKIKLDVQAIAGKDVLIGTGV